MFRLIIFSGTLIFVQMISLLGAEVNGSSLIIPEPLKDLGKKYKIRVVYFVPSDKKVKKDYQKKAEVLMRVVADVYRREIKANGFKTRGLDFEFNQKSELVVHLVKAKEKSSHYTGSPFNIDHFLNSHQQEIWEKTGFSRNRPTLVFSEAGSVAEARPIPQVYSGLACVSADALSDAVTASMIETQINNFQVLKNNKADAAKISQTSNGVIIHEIGHIFGMLHDTSDSKNIMMRGYDNLGQMYKKKESKNRPVRFSRAHARIASYSRFLNESFDESDTEPPSIEEFNIEKKLKAGDQSIGVVVKISDNKGLGSIIIMQRGGGQIDALVADYSPEGEKKYNKKVSVKCPKPLVPNQPLILIVNVMDVNGNLSQSVIQSQIEPD